MKKKVLVVDDQEINRKILQNILKDNYEVLEAADGVQALKALRQYGRAISAVLLDLVMPVKDGYEVLLDMKQDPVMCGIPVIVASQADKIEAEVKALDYGAKDFIAKPYNAAVLKCRLANLVELYETHDVLHQLERDELTGLYNRDAFMNYGTKMLEETEGICTLVVTDIERFKLINDTYGKDEGDQVLRYISARMNQEVGKHGICGRLNADHFCALLNRNLSNEDFEDIARDAEESIKAYPLNMKITMKFGMCRIPDTSVTLDRMCDRVLLAAESVKGQYNRSGANYDDSIRQKLLREQAITDSMKQALQEGQYQVYLQPKYDLKSECIAGAEALVRWNHPTLGFLSPGEFIPLFERNGFISELDRYVWDKTAGYIQEWMRTAGKYIPVSVNVSRKDIYRSHLADTLMEIVNRHGLSPEQMHLEITESAYTENPEQLIEAVSNLKKLGFVIEMDDFGTGYSSLNMLSELPIDILKMDMRFIQKETERNGSRNIISFVISLAKWLNLLVIAEGVETREQVDLLRSMQCNYVQGYYYARPMPAEEFRQLVINSKLALPENIRLTPDRSVSHFHGTGAGQILLISDELKCRHDQVKQQFEGMYNVVEMNTEEETIQFLETHFDEIAAVMLHVSEKNDRGLKVLQRIHENPVNSLIPVIVIGKADEITETQAFSLGADEFLQCPFGDDALMHRVQNVTA